MKWRQLVGFGSLIRIIGVASKVTELFEKGLAVSFPGFSRHQQLFKSIPVLVTRVTVTGFTEVLEVLAISAPAVAVFIVLPSVFPSNRFAAGDAGNLLIRPILPESSSSHCQRSTSPIIVSRLPSVATKSATDSPFAITGSADKLENDGPRILNRAGVSVPSARI